MFNKILVAIDGSKISKKAIEMAKQFTHEQQSEIILIHVGKELLPPPGVAVMNIDQINQLSKQECRKLLSKEQQWLKEHGVDSKTVYVEGNPAKQIVHYAKKEQCQLIIIGSRGLGNFKEFMLGSVSHKVSQISHCPVLIVK